MSNNPPVLNQERLCIHKHHAEYGQPLKCPKCGKNETMRCGPFMHACEKCDPVWFDRCRICGTTRVFCSC